MPSNYNAKMFMTFGLMFSLFSVSACQMTYDMSGYSEVGNKISGSMISDGTGVNSVSIGLSPKVNCSGNYKATGKPVDMKLSCSDGSSGVATVTPDANRMGGKINFKLSNGAKGEVSTKGENANIQQPDADNSTKSAKKLPEVVSPRKTEIFTVNSYKVSSSYTLYPASHINGTNLSDKVIKYLKYDITPYNRVGDVQRGDRVQLKSTQTVTIVGPIMPGEVANGMFEVWDNFTITCIVINRVSIVYMDGTEKTYNGQAEVQSTFAPGLRNSCAVQ